MKKLRIQNIGGICILFIFFWMIILFCNSCTNGNKLQMERDNPSESSIEGEGSSLAVSEVKRKAGLSRRKRKEQGMPCVDQVCMAMNYVYGEIQALVHAFQAGEAQGRALEVEREERGEEAANIREEQMKCLREAAQQAATLENAACYRGDAAFSQAQAMQNRMTAEKNAGRLESAAELRKEVIIQLEEAAEHYKEAAERSKRSKCVAFYQRRAAFIQAVALENRALAAENQEKRKDAAQLREEAAKHFEEAARQSRKPQDIARYRLYTATSRANAAINRAIVEENLGGREEAANYHEEAAQCYEEAARQSSKSDSAVQYLLNAAMNRVEAAEHRAAVSESEERGEDAARFCEEAVQHCEKVVELVEKPEDVAKYLKKIAQLCEEAARHWERAGQQNPGKMDYYRRCAAHSRAKASQS